jgi:hypothetical protein
MPAAFENDQKPSEHIRTPIALTTLDIWRMLRQLFLRAGTICCRVQLKRHACRGAAKGGTKMLSGALISDNTGEMTFAQWREAMCHTYSVTKCSQLVADEFSGHLENRRFGGITVGNIRSTPLCYKRGMDEIRLNPIDDFLILLMLEGAFAVEQERAVAIAKPGDLLIYHQAKPFELRIERSYRAITFAVPYAAMGCVTVS